MPFFNNRGPIRSNLTGFRLLLSVPVFMNQRDAEFNERQGYPDLAQALLKSRTILLSTSESPDLQNALSATQKELERLQAEKDVHETNTAGLKTSLTSIQAKLERSIAQLNERDKRIRRDQFSSAVLMSENIRNLLIRISVAEARIEAFEEEIREDPDNPDLEEIKSAIPKYRKKIADLKLANAANFDNYVTTIYALAGAGEEAAAAAERATAEWFKVRKLIIFDRMQVNVAKHVRQSIRAGGAVSTSQLKTWRWKINKP